MKKMLSVLLVLTLLLLHAVCAAAMPLYGEGYTDVPSVMTQDSVREFVVEPDEEVEVLQPYEETSAQLEELYDFVWKQQNRPVRYYDEETQLKIGQLIEGVSIDSLYMTEFMGLQLSVVEEAEETVGLRVTLGNDYYVGQLIVVVLGRRNDDGDYRWYVYRGEVTETGVIRCDVPAAEYAELTQQRTVFHVLTIRDGAGRADGDQQAMVEETARPSKEAKDLRQVTGWKSASGEEIDDQFRIYFVDYTKPMSDEILKMEEFAAEGNAPIEWFPEELRQQAQELKTDGVALEEMEIYDIAAVMAEEYKDTYGDISTVTQFPTSYRDDREMFAMLGFWTEQGEFEWYCLRAEAVEVTPDATIVYKQLTLPRMEEEPAMLVVFSEPLTEDEA